MGRPTATTKLLSASSTNPAALATLPPASRWCSSSSSPPRRAVTGAHLVPLVRVGARFENGQLLERAELAA
ncbi:hypothetical protein ACFYWB_23540 [Streptomyces misionensis]|uniref:hypothetical protein n=1 Tax=Streptomyces misionensis TaxID=67331 RepID=UPI00369865EA